MMRWQRMKLSLSKWVEKRPRGACAGTGEEYGVPDEAFWAARDARAAAIDAKGERK